MKRLTLASALAWGLAVLAINLMTPRPAHAFIHEIIAALCRFGNEEVIPPGQVKGGFGTQSFVRALQATGLIAGIDQTATNVTIHFNPDIPASKFRDAGVGTVTIPNGIAPGVSLTLDPAIEPDPDFAAHTNCHFSPF
jgi:hypothetical protein